MTVAYTLELKAPRATRWQDVGPLLVAPPRPVALGYDVYLDAAGVARGRKTTVIQDCDWRLTWWHHSQKPEVYHTRVLEWRNDGQIRVRIG